MPRHRYYTPAKNDKYTIVRCPPVTYNGVTVDDFYPRGATLSDFAASLREGCIPDGTVLERDGRRYVVREKQVVSVGAAPGAHADERGKIGS